MKLLIGGKSRNIYMRKDGSAYYKSGGQQVDITHMFKKNGGGLKKKYIKGGTTEEEFKKLQDKCIELHKRLKELHDELKGHTFDETKDATSGEIKTKVFIEKKLKEYYEGDGQPLKTLAGEISALYTSGKAGGDSVVLNYKTLVQKLDPVFTDIESLVNSGDSSIKKDLENILKFFEKAEDDRKIEELDENKKEILKRLIFFEEAIKEIKQIGGTSGEAGQTNTASTNINTTLPVNVLSNFETNIEKFNRNFFNLAHLVISVINTVNTDGENLEIKSDNGEEIEKLVQKLNALINLFYKSLRADTKGNEGVFITKDASFESNVMKNTSKFKTVYLQIGRTNQEHTYSIKNKDKLLNDDILSKIFKTFGSICKSMETPATAPVLGRNPISKQAIATNINKFLNREEVLAKEIKIPDKI